MPRKIVTDIRILNQISEEIPIQGIEPEPCEEILMVVEALEESLATTEGYGLTAIQIGIPVRVAIVRVGKTKLDLFNPKIIKKADRFKFVGEKCLSLPGFTIDTARYNYIVLENGNGKKYALEGLEAIVVQHEIAHMNGKTILDYKWRKKR